MVCKLEDEQSVETPEEPAPNETENSIRNTIYSVGIDQMPNLKERITEVHGANSEVMKAVAELDCYVSSPEARNGPWYWNFFRRVKSRMWALCPHAGDIVRTSMAREYIEELLNGGYIRTLQFMSAKCGAKYVSFAREYANCYSAPIGASLLFGPRGGATMELLHFLAAERVHGMHRNGISPNPYFTKETRKMWYGAQRIGNWPVIKNEKGQEVPLDMVEEQGCLPEGVATALREMWRRNPALRDYTGTNRLSGDMPFQIIEDVIDVMIQRRFLPLDKVDKARYDYITEDANKQGIDPFYAVYRNLFANRDRLRPYWNRARKWLYDYSILLWESQNQLWLAEGKRVPANGAIYRPKKITVCKSKKKSVPGTIYLNNSGYYWTVARKMKPRPLIDPKSKPKVPGSFIVNNGRYYWWIPGWLNRQRLIPKGEKFSTKDKATALRIAKKLWAQIQKNDPELAANIREHTRINGTATKDRAVAVRVAAKMWRQIQKEEPELAARILMDNRPKAEDHWYAQIVVNRKHRFIGSFKTRAEAQAAYAKEFEKVFGYPPGYNVQCIPKIDKVWPTWAEEKARLVLMNEHPRMPVIGQSTKMEPLEPFVKRMQRIDWVVENCILVFDNNAPVALQNVAIQSRGEKWYAEIKKQGKRPIIQGCASIDADTGRIRITVYGQGFSQSRVLTEEVYHIVFEIIRHASPKTFESIKKWYSNRLKHGLDPTWHIHEAFVDLMVQEEEFPGSTDLPRHAVKYARRAFSTNNTVPDSAIERIKAGV
ncbi:hypothetical protein ACFL3Q_11495 [Planctomycetota bacterium]